MQDDKSKIKMKEFAFSEKFVQQRKSMFLIAIPFLILFLAAFAFYFSNFRIKLTLIAVGKALLMCGIISAVEVPLINRRQRKMKVVVYEDKLVKQCGKKQKVLFWDDICRVKTVKNTRDVIVNIRLYSKKLKTIMYIGGFREMGELANLIKEKTSEKVLLQETQWKLNWNNPLVLIITFCLTMIMMFIIGLIGSKAMDIFAILFSLCLGLCLLMFRPLSKLLMLKWVDVTLAGVVFILAVWGFVCFVMFGKVP